MPVGLLPVVCPVGPCAHAQPCPVHRPRPAWTKSSPRPKRGRPWRRFVDQVRAEEPICQLCQRRPTEEVDHKIPVAEGGRTVRENLQGVCLTCHKAKTAKESARARRGGG